MSYAGQRLVSTVNRDGRIVVTLDDHAFAAPTGFEILVQVEAAPINPSDLALLFGPADLAEADFAPGRVSAPLPEAAQRAFVGRLDQPMPVGNEGAGTVIAAGEEAFAQALIGKRVAGAPGAMFATHALADARMVMPLPDAVSAIDGASAFVNPMTALGFVGTARLDGHGAIIHTAAASNLGQMLVRLCAEEELPLVNVVRSPAQEALLRGLGAEHVVDSSADDFMERLVAAISATDAMLGFDAIGGGRMAANLLSAMEQVASRGARYSRYGSDRLKQVYIYGALDLSPTLLTRNFGFTWRLGGWLLTNYLPRVGIEGAMTMRQRVLAGLTTTFASHYKAQVSLAQMLEPDVARAYNAKITGEKFLIVP